MAEKPPLKVFYSYSHSDERLRDRLRRAAALLVRQGIIQEWHDREISPGEAWAEEIDDHLEAADIILLLVSADFIASDYCWGREVARALERHNEGTARVIPIIVRPVDWMGAPFGRLQALPKDAKPVTLWSNMDLAWLDVAKGLRKVAEEMAAGVPPIPAAEQPIVAGTLPASREAGGVRIAGRPGGGPKRHIYTAENREKLPGKLARAEGDPPTGDIAVDEAYDGLGRVYQFFWDVFERDSVDGRGLPLEATVHFGKEYANAFWNGKQMILGDGDGRLFNRFTIAIDILGKEFANAVVQADTQLAYWQESGALFNSIATVLAALVKQYTLQETVDRAAWLVGEGLLGPKVNGKALFSLAEPGTAYDDPVLGKDPQPAHMRDYVQTANDAGGIHINSGIPNRAFYLVATALGGYAWERAGRIWYETMRDKQLGSKARFREFARLTLANARRLYGEGSDEAQAVRRGWETVGIRVTGR